MKKIIVILLCVIMIFSMFTTTSLAYDSLTHLDDPHDPVFSGLTEFKIEDHQIVEGINTLSNGEITIELEALATNGELNNFKWKLITGGYLIKYVFVKAGPGGNLYEYTNGSILEDEWLQTPELKNVSHITFYYCNIPNPSISLEKNADKNEVFVGDIVTYTLTATNNGNVPLTDVYISDVKFGQTPLIGPVNLDVGEQVTTSFDYIVLEKDYNWLDNYASTRGEYNGHIVTDNAQLSIPVDCPYISIVKKVTPDIALVGETVNYEIIVENTGYEELTGVMVTDHMFNLHEIIGYLDVGDCRTIRIPYTIKPEDGELINNTASVIGFYRGEIVIAESSAQVTVARPSIIVNKEVIEPYALIGDEINYRITVINTGNVDLTNVVISDPMFGDLPEFHIAVLKPGEQYKYVVPVPLTHDVTANDLPKIINTASVSGWYKTNELTASDSATIRIYNPAIDIKKSITNTESEFYSGDSIHYLIEVTNTGTIDLTNVFVTDSMFSDARFNIGNLKAGEKVSISIDYIVQQIDEGKVLTNVVEVEGYFDDCRVYDRDDAVAKILDNIITKNNPQITINKTANVDKAKIGDEVIYHFRIENTGDMDLLNVIVTDTILGTRVNFDIGDLAVGEVIEFDEEYTIPEGTEFPLENIAEVKGYFNEGENDYVTDENSFIIEENSKKLPKTGERNPIFIQLLGIIILGAGIVLGVSKRRIN